MTAVFMLAGSLDLGCDSISNHISGVRNLLATSVLIAFSLSSGSLPAMRFLTAVAEKEKDGDRYVENVSREVWMRIWSRDEDICDPASLSEAGLKAGLSSSDVEEIIAMAKSQPIKDKLKQTTAEAIKYDAFGFPLIVCHVDGKPKVFFGSDRFELMAHCIGEKWLGPQPDKRTAHL